MSEGVQGALIGALVMSLLGHLFQYFQYRRVRKDARKDYDQQLADYKEVVRAQRIREHRDRRDERYRRMLVELHQAIQLFAPVARTAHLHRTDKQRWSDARAEALLYDDPALRSAIGEVDKAVEERKPDHDPVPEAAGRLEQCVRARLNAMETTAIPKAVQLAIETTPAGQ